METYQCWGVDHVTSGGRAKRKDKQVLVPWRLQQSGWLECRPVWESGQRMPAISTEAWFRYHLSMPHISLALFQRREL